MKTATEKSRLSRTSSRLSHSRTPPCMQRWQDAARIKRGKRARTSSSPPTTKASLFLLLEPAIAIVFAGSSDGVCCRRSRAGFLPATAGILPLLPIGGIFISNCPWRVSGGIVRRPLYFRLGVSYLVEQPPYCDLLRVNRRQTRFVLLEGGPSYSTQLYSTRLNFTLLHSTTTINSTCRFSSHPKERKKVVVTVVIYIYIYIVQLEGNSSLVKLSLQIYFAGE